MSREPKVERAYWDAIAHDEEKIYDDWLTRETQEAVYKFLRRHPLCRSVLELGCGNGRLMNYAARRMLQRDFLGLDISPKMLGLAREQAPENANYMGCKGRSIVTPQLFEAVYCVTMFQHLEPEVVAQYIKEVADALKPRGHFLLQFIEGSEHEPYSHHYSIAQMEAWLAAAGLMLAKTYNAVHPSWTWMEAEKL